MTEQQLMLVRAQQEPRHFLLEVGRLLKKMVYRRKERFLKMTSETSIPTHWFINLNVEEILTLDRFSYTLMTPKIHWYTLMKELGISDLQTKL